MTISLAGEPASVDVWRSAICTGPPGPGGALDSAAKCLGHVVACLVEEGRADATADELAGMSGLPSEDLESALWALEAKGWFSPGPEALGWHHHGELRGGPLPALTLPLWPTMAVRDQPTAATVQVALALSGHGLDYATDVMPAIQAAHDATP